MEDDIELPSKGIVFWPVGTGDSTTIFIDDERILQLDIHHMVQSEDEDEESHPVIDHLISTLPEVDGVPYLSTFALTHPDKDHVKGFAELLKEVTVGELWFSPRIFKEDDDDLHEDAIAFREEAERRVQTVIDSNGEVGSGDRVRIIGYDGILDVEFFDGFPEQLISYPGETIVELDGEDVSEQFSAFIHSPFKGTDSEDRNDTSLGMQVTLVEGNQESKFLLLGDLKYEGIRKIFDITKENDNEDTLEWNVLLAPHHCSKSVMYVKNENDNYVLKQDLLNDLEKASLESGYIVASSKSIPERNSPGDNPPHAKAKHRYQEIVPIEFMCTHENPIDNTKPIAFELTIEGLVLLNADTSIDAGEKSLSTAVSEARGTNKPPKETAGFGC